MLHLLLGTDWTANRDQLLYRIAGDVKEKKGGRILMVPELISHETERRLCAAAGDTASRYAEVLSFTRLAKRVAEELGCAMEECLDAGGRVVAMASAARQLHSRLKAYASVESRPEFLTGLLDAVDEFKRCCISSQDLILVAAQTEGSLAQKLEELALILEAYDGICKQGKRDPRDQMTWLLERMEDSDFGRNHVFYIDGFPDFTLQHLEILKHLIRVSPNVTVSLNCDRVSSERLAFDTAGSTASKILESAREAGVPVQIEIISPAPNPLQPLRDCLFQGAIEKGGLKDKLKVYHGDAPAAECMAAAEHILDLIRSGCRYRDITVVCGDLGSYKPLVNLAFHRCGIPLYLSGTEDVLQKSVVSTVLSAMDAALGGFDQKAMLRYLRSALSPLDPDTCDDVENYAVVWGIRGKKWQETWVNHPDGLSGQWDDRSDELLERLNRARELAVAPLTGLRTQFQSATKLEQQVQALYGFLEEIGLEQRLDSLAAEMDVAGDNRSAQILNQLWEILMTALEQLHDVLGQTQWDSETFTRLLMLLLSQYDVGTIPPVLDAVQVGPVSAMRCHQEKHLIVLGAQEGNLPGYSGSAGVLTDQERVILRQLAVPLTGGAMDGIQAEFAEIYGVFCGAMESVTVCYSGGQPSFICRRLAEMAGEETEIQPSLGAALADSFEAGAYLARWNARDTAQKIGVDAGYDEICHRRSFTLGKVEREQINRLYGKQLVLSASQIDRQAVCRLSYFLKYGLRAKERKEATVDPSEFGTYVHAVLENTGRHIRDLGGFRHVSLEQTLEIAAKYSDEYAKVHFSQIDSQRLNYLFRRNGQELTMVIQELWEELQNSQFQPADFEVNFGGEDGLPPVAVGGAQMKAIVRGYVDRVDTWNMFGNSYYRVVDYKTGKKDFDYCDVFNGVGLQMLLYLFALQETGESVVGSNPIPAGVQYFPARVSYVNVNGRMDEQTLEKEREKERKRKGLLLKDEQVLQAMEPGDKPKLLCYKVKNNGTLDGDLADREQLKELKAYLYHILGKMVDEIASGTVEPNPYTRGSSYSACTYCPYGAVCHQDSVEGRRNYKTMTSERFWEEIEKELRNGG